MAAWFRWGKVKGEDGQELNQAPEQAAPSMFFCKEKNRWRTIKKDGEESSEEEAPLAPPPKMGEIQPRRESDKAKVEAWNPGHIKRVKRMQTNPAKTASSVDPFNPLASFATAPPASRRPEVKAVQAAGNPFAPRKLMASQAGPVIKENEQSESPEDEKSSPPMKSPFGHNVGSSFEDHFAAPAVSFEDRFAIPQDAPVEEPDVKPETSARTSSVMFNHDDETEFNSWKEDPFDALIDDEPSIAPNTHLTTREASIDDAEPAPQFPAVDVEPAPQFPAIDVEPAPQFPAIDVEPAPQSPAIGTVNVEGDMAHTTGYPMGIPPEEPVITAMNVDESGALSPEAHKILHTTDYPMGVPPEEPETHTDSATTIYSMQVTRVEPPIIDVVDVDETGIMAPEAHKILHTTGYPMEIPPEEPDTHPDSATTIYSMQVTHVEPPTIDVVNVDETGDMAPQAHAILHTTGYPMDAAREESPTVSVINTEANSPEAQPILHNTGHPMDDQREQFSAADTNYISRFPSGEPGIHADVDNWAGCMDDLPKLIDQDPDDFSFEDDDNDVKHVATHKAQTDVKLATHQKLALTGENNDALAAAYEKLTLMEQHRNVDGAYARELEQKLMDTEKSHAAIVLTLEERLMTLEKLVAQSSEKDEAFGRIKIMEQEMDLLLEKNAALQKHVSELSKQRSLSSTPQTKATASMLSKFSMDTTVTLEKATEMIETLTLVDNDECAVKDACLEIERKTGFEIENRDPVLKSGGVEAIIYVLEKHESHEEIICSAMGALWNLTFSNEAVDYITRANKITCILQVMDVHPDSEKIQTACCATLMNLATSRENRRSIVQFHGLLRLVTAAEKHASSAPVVEQVCQALYMLAFHKDAKRSVRDANALAAAEIAKHHPTKSAQKWGTWLEEILL